MAPFHYDPHKVEGRSKFSEVSVIKCTNTNPLPSTPGNNGNADHYFGG